jgi:6-phosphogluconolactonase
MKTISAKLNLSIVDSSQDLAQELLELFFNVAQEAIDVSGRFCVALSRHTLEIFLELFNSDSRSKSLPWNKIHFFWVDQCCRPWDCGKDNFSTFALAFISKVNMPSKNMHCICSGGLSCEVAASKYEQTISNLVRHKIDGIPKFDLILLQMEPDGHIASLFPDTYAFFENKRLVSATHFMDARYTRITMTHPILYAASNIVVLVSGREKAEILKEIFTRESNIAQYPVHALWPVLDKVMWMVDRDAAKFLPPGISWEGGRTTK